MCICDIQQIVKRWFCEYVRRIIYPSQHTSHDNIRLCAGVFVIQHRLVYKSLNNPYCVRWRRRRFVRILSYHWNYINRVVSKYVRIRNNIVLVYDTKLVSPSVIYKHTIIITYPR